MRPRSADYNEAFKTVVESLTRGMALREVASATGVSHAGIDDMRRFAKVPHYVGLQKFANGLEVPPKQRAELFIAAGYRAEETPEVRRLIAGLREAGYDVQDADYLTPATVDAILAAVGIRER